MAAFTLWDGTTEKAADLTAWDGATEKPVSKADLMPYGYSSYSEMLAQHPFYVAHRGGSANWPEESMYSYTQAVAWGAPALELSVARTSDGVWFGIHDADINRTSGTTGLPAASQMTWAQVQQYTINQFGRHDPYARMIDILDAYAGSHLFFIDPKNAVSQMTELFAILKSYPRWDSMVIKYFHDSKTVADKARAAGFKSWGYYYEADAPQAATTGAYWDLLGMDYNASQAAWNQVLALGKPVLGHICPNATAASTALSKGAVGLMCSGIQQIVPTAGLL